MSFRTFRLSRKLRRARRAGKIYLVARYVVMLRGMGIQVSLTSQEFKEVLSALDAARDGKGVLPTHSGYEVARWILLIRELQLDPRLIIADEDLNLIQQAADFYHNEKNLRQLASLLFTCGQAGLTLRVDLDDREIREIQARIATMD